MTELSGRKLTEQIMVRLAPAEREALAAEAERSERTVAQVVRFACKRYLAEIAGAALEGSSTKRERDVMADPATLDEYNAKAMANQSISGFGADVVTHFPCPGCAAPGWMDFPITAALNDYRDVQDPSTCSACGRSFRFAITVERGGAAYGGSTEGTFIQTGGPDLPPYLPPMPREDAT